MAVALYLQYVEYLDPCPLCILQRLAVIVIGVIALLAALHNPRQTGQRIYGLLLCLVSAVGAAIAGWHVYLQHLPPDEVPECGPGLEFMLRRFPLDEVLAKVFTGSGECAEILWQFLGLSIPAWTLVAFVFLEFLGIYIIGRRNG